MVIIGHVEVRAARNVVIIKGHIISIKHRMEITGVHRRTVHGSSHGMLLLLLLRLLVAHHVSVEIRTMAGHHTCKLDVKIEKENTIYFAKDPILI